MAKEQSWEQRYTKKVDLGRLITQIARENNLTPAQLWTMMSEKKIFTPLTDFDNLKNGEVLWNAMLRYVSICNSLHAPHFPFS